VDRTTKLFGINAGHGKSIAAFRAEAAKCVLVCANCHGEIETGLIACPRLGARYTSQTV
jgi:cytochrome c553